MHTSCKDCGVLVPGNISRLHLTSDPKLYASTLDLASSGNEDHACCRQHELGGFKKSLAGAKRVHHGVSISLEDSQERRPLSIVLCSLHLIRQPESSRCLAGF